MLFRVEIDGISICNGGCQAIADTGAALVVGPAVDINIINARLGMADSDHSIDCSKVDSLPSTSTFYNQIPEKTVLNFGY